MVLPPWEVEKERIMFKLISKLRRNRKGAAMVEYALLVAGVALMALAAVSVFGHKTNDLISAVAAVLPGAHLDDNGPITSGRLVETTAGAAGAPIELDVPTILANSGTQRLGNNMGVTGLPTLVLDPNQ
jgi:Flp pilus assembly pilin Flp